SRNGVVATGCDQGYVLLWRARTGRPLHPPLPQFWLKVAVEPPTVLSVAFSADGKVLAAGTTRGEIYRWDVAAGTAIAPVLYHGLRVDVWDVAFSPDGQTLVSAGGDGRVRRWRADTGQPVEPALACRDSVAAAAFDPGGAKILTATRAGVVEVWDAA